ncbi:MAG: hypothetical protein LH624_20350, partial [Cryobacterium sp.]|nr:hypothetical protein [Cryobacterium sp.]
MGAIPETPVKKLTEKVALVGIVLSTVPALGTLYISITRGPNPVPIVVALIGSALSVLLFFIMKRRWLTHEQLQRASRIVLIALFLLYCAAPFYIEIFGLSNFADSISWFAVLWILVVVTECSIIVRVSGVATDDRIGKVALIVVISLFGTAVMGLAAASGAVSVREFRTQDSFTAWSVAGEAIALGLLS